MNDEIIQLQRGLSEQVTLHTIFISSLFSDAGFFFLFLLFLKLLITVSSYVFKLLSILYFCRLRRKNLARRSYTRLFKKARIPKEGENNFHHWILLMMSDYLIASILTESYYDVYNIYLRLRDLEQIAMDHLVELAYKKLLVSVNCQ